MDEVKSTAHVEVLYRATRSVINLQDLDEIFQTIVDGAAEALHADRVLLFAIDVDTERVTHIAKGGPDPTPIVRVEYAELWDGLAGWALRERKTAFSPQSLVGSDPRETLAVQQRRVAMEVGSILVVPILYRDTILGILTAVNTMAQPDFTAEDVALIEALADQAAAAIRNGKLLAEVQHRAHLLSAGAEVARIVTSILTLEEMLPQVVNLLQERLDLYYAGLFLLDETGQWAVLRAGSGAAGTQMLAARHCLEVGGDSMIGACVADGRARIALDVGKEARRFDNPYLPQTHSEMALPLTGRGQRILGAMTIQSERAAAFTDADITSLQTMADQIATAIENALLFEQRERRIKDLSVVTDLQQALASAHDLDAIIRNAYEQVSRVFDTKDFYIATYREGSDEWTLAFQMAHGDFQPVRTYKLGQGLTGYIIRNRRSLHLANLDANRAFMESQGLALIGDEARSWLGVPLVTADTIVGVMAIENYEYENLFSVSDVELLSTIALQVANALEANRLFVETRQRAVQLQTAAEVARATSSILDPQELLLRAVELIQERFDYYYVGVFLTDPERRWAVLQAGTGEAGRQMLTAGHKLEIGGASMIGACIADARPRIALDVVAQAGIELVRFDNPYLPDTHSEMAVPLRRGEQVIGALTVQSVVREAFSQEDITLMLTVADQLATALENARLFAESQRGIAEMNLLYQAASELSASPNYAAILEVLRRYTVLGEAESFVSVERFDRPWQPDVPPAALSRLARWAPEALGEAFDAHYLLALADAVQILRPDTPVLISDLLQEPRLGESTRRFFHERFKARSLALIPLVAGGEWNGFLVAAYRQARDFAPVEARVLMNLAGQAAVALENLVRLEAISRKDVEQSALINNIPDTVYFKDLELRFTRVNPAQARMLGVDTPEQAIGKSDLDFFVGVSAEEAFQDDLRVVRDGISIIGRLEHIVNREGQSRWFSATKIPLRDVTGTIIGLVGISSDVTELKAMQDVAQQRAVRLQQAVQISRTLSALLDSEALLSQAATLIHERLGYAGVGIFLRDESPGAAEGEAISWLLLRAGVGDRVAAHLAEKLRLPLDVSTPLGLSVVQREAQIATEVSVPLISQAAQELALPLLRGEQALGVLCIQSATIEQLESDAIAVLQTVADQLANALEITRLLTEAERSVRQLEAVVGTYTVDSWREFIAKAGRLRGYRYRGFDLEVATERTPEATQAWLEGRPVIYRQTAPAAADAVEGGAVLAVPIRVREQVIGVLNVRSRSGGELAPDAVPLLEEVAARLGQALETARLLEDTRARALREQLAGEISGRVRAEVEVESLLDRALRELSLALGVRRAAVELEVRE